MIPGTPPQYRGKCPTTPLRLDQGVQNRTIGIPKEYFVGGLDPEVEQAIRQAVEVFEKKRGPLPGNIPAPYRVRHSRLLYHRHGRSQLQPGPL